MNKLQTTRYWRLGTGSAPVELATECALLLYTEGRAYVFFNRKRHTLTGRHILYVQPETCIRIEAADSGEHGVIGLFFRSYELREQTEDTLIYRLDYSKLPANGYVLRPLASRLPALMRQLARMEEGDPIDEYTRDHGMDELVRHLIAQMNRNPVDRPTSGQAINITIQAMLEYCERDWTRDKAARDSGFNTSHFSRAFKQKTGYSFSDFLSKVRLNRARILLMATDLTLDGIARRTGFLNGLYLSRRFKQDCGLPPSAYRLRMKREALRIAAMQHAGDLLALGLQPVAASFASWHASPLLHDRLVAGGTAASYELEDVELLASLRLDLIIIPDYLLYQNASRLQQFERIAPVLFLPAYRHHPIDRLRQVASILGCDEAAERWISDYHKQADSWRKKISGTILEGESVALYEIRGDDEIIIWHTHMRGAYNLYEAMQFLPPDAIASEVLAAGKSLTIPTAALPEYAADHMFVILGETGGVYERFFSMAEAHPVWSSLDACRYSRLYRLPLSSFWSDDGMTLVEQLPVLAQAVKEATKRAETRTS